MRFNISGEIHADVDESYGELSITMEDVINSTVENTNYGAGVENIDLIGIVLPGTIVGFPERKKYWPKEKDAEFRLVIDHTKFKSASKEEQEKLLFAMAQRSVTLIKTLNIPDFDVAKLEKDLTTIGESQGWTDS